MPHPSRKLSPEQVREIRRAHGLKLALVDALHSLYDKRALAERYGVTETTIDRLVRGETYKDQHGHAPGGNHGNAA